MSKVKCDADGLMLRLSQIGDRAMRGISDVMVEEGENMMRLARSFAPVDDGNLEESIRMEVGRTGVHGRIQVYIYIDEDIEVSAKKVVGDYATLMHEGLAPYGSGRWNLGPKSQAKANAGNDVGGKFMKRAADERLKPMMQRVVSIVRRAL